MTRFIQKDDLRIVNLLIRKIKYERIIINSDLSQRKVSIDTSWRIYDKHLNSEKNILAVDHASRIWSSAIITLSHRLIVSHSFYLEKFRLLLSRYVFFSPLYVVTSSRSEIFISVFLKRFV